MNNNAKEVLVGGLMGLIAVIAIFLKLSLADFSSSAVLDSLIELSSIGVSLAIFYAFISSKTPSINFDKRMNKAFKDWIDSTNGLITDTELIKDEKLGEVHRCYMVVNYQKYFKGDVITSKDVGEFVRIPNFKSENYLNNVEISFYLNKSIMLNVLTAKNAHEKNDEKAKLIMQEYADGILKKLLQMYGDIEVIQYPKHMSELKYETIIKLKGNFTKQDQINNLFKVINYIMMLYAYAA